MRILSGSYKNKPLKFPPASITRPVGDKVRAAIFDVLGDVTGGVMLDAYAGSGAVGFEALSRGVSLVEAIEANRQAIRVIEDNRRELGEFSYILHKMTVERWLALPDGKKRRYSLIFMDPPYDALDTEIITRLGQYLTDEGILVLSHSGRLDAPMVESLRYIQTKRYGDTSVSFYQA